MKSIISTLNSFVFAATLLPCVPAYADSITLTLTNPEQFGGSSLGSSLSFDATVAASSTNSADMFLNADSFSVDAPLALDDDGFFRVSTKPESGGKLQRLAVHGIPSDVYVECDI